MTADIKFFKKIYNAHIVEDKVSALRGYALFEAGEIKNDKFIKSADTPSMVMISPEKQNLKLSFVDPDLRLYEGRDESQYDENGNMKEVSIYSRREWNGNESIPHTSTLVLKGKYKLSEENKNVSVEVKGNETILKITTTYGMPVEVVLKKIK